MAFLGIYGPHAVGKTTAFQKFLTELRDSLLPVTIINCDNARESRWLNGPVPELQVLENKLWKRSPEEKGTQVDECVADDTRLYIAESARFDQHRFIADANLAYDGGTQVILLVAQWKTFRQWMLDRNAKNGTEFNAEYWTPSKLVYEGHDRYVNQARKYLEPGRVPYKVIEMDYERKAWAEVEKLMRSLADRPVKSWYNS